MSSARSDGSTVVKLKLDRALQRCAAEPDDELYPNGIFEFNITRLLSFIEDNVDRFPAESVGIADIPNYGSEGFDEETIRTANLLRPVLLPEISPGRFNLIDGHHRVAKARREGVNTIPAYRVAYPFHVLFLTSTLAYERYVQYWNERMACRPQP